MAVSEQGETSQLVYRGPMPTPGGMRVIAEPEWNISFVYHVFDKSLDPLYVGCTGAPYGRWTAHQRSAMWWRYAAYVDLYRIIAHDHADAKRAGLAAESAAIRLLLPRFNRHGPATLPFKRRGRR